MIVMNFLYALAAAADSVNMFEPVNVLRFADHLFERKEYEAALNEYRRFVFLADSQPEQIADRIVECLVEQKEFSAALAETGRFPGGAKKQYTRGMIFYLAGAYDSSRSYLNELGAPYLEPARQLIGAGYAGEFDFEKAGEYIELPLPGPRYKNSSLAGLLALAPGAGHVYSGRVSDGFYALAIVGTASGLAWYYGQRGENIKFGISLGAAIVFYAGSIYGGVNAARNYNFSQDLAYLEKIRENLDSRQDDFDPAE